MSPYYGVYTLNETSPRALLKNQEEAKWWGDIEFMPGDFEIKKVYVVLMPDKKYVDVDLEESVE